MVITALITFDNLGVELSIVLIIYTKLLMSAWATLKRQLFLVPYIGLFWSHKIYDRTLMIDKY